MKLNETPVRTSRNYKINNVEINDFKMPVTAEKFENVHISGFALVEENVNINPVVYGLSKEMYENVQNMANSRLKVKCGKCINIDKVNGEDTENRTSELVNSNIMKNKNEIVSSVFGSDNEVNNVSRYSRNSRIVYEMNDTNTVLINYIEIIAENDANIVIEYKTNTNKECFINSIVKVNAYENANVNVVLVNLLNKESHFFITMENKLEKNSNLYYTIVDLGAKNSIENYYSNISGENANNSLKSIYIGSGEEIIDLNYIAEITGEKATVDIDVQGALRDKSKKNFKGTINFKKGCKKAVGDENEYCMLLSKEAKSIALPMLLCTEDDVQGNHATASGKLDDKELFYIMSRGLDKHEATKLIVKSRFNVVLDRIFDEDVKQEVVEVIDSRL